VALDPEFERNHPAIDLVARHELCDLLTEILGHDHVGVQRENKGRFNVRMVKSE
jgi:hypothetical protein